MSVFFSTKEASDWLSKLTNLSKLPPFGYEISCFPFNLDRESK